MEDEHVCVDNLVEHLGETSDFPLPGAFYGVSCHLHTFYLLLPIVKQENFMELLKLKKLDDKVLVFLCSFILWLL